MPNRTVRVSGSGHPPTRSGAPARVSNSASSGGELGRLVAGDVAGAHVPGQRLQDRRGDAHRERDREGPAVEGSAGRRSSASAWIPATAKPVAAYAASVMWSACERAAGLRIAASGFEPRRSAALQLGRPAGCVHPRVGDDHEDPREPPRHGDQDPGQEVGPGLHAVPAVEVDAEEDRLGEEGEPLEGERHADDRAGELHEAGPEEAQLEREHGAGDRADREEDGGALGPPPGEVEVDRVARSAASAARRSP